MHCGQSAVSGIEGGVEEARRCVVAVAPEGAPDQVLEGVIEGLPGVEDGAREGDLRGRAQEGAVEREACVRSLDHACMRWWYGR